jgi:hypothetical protein
MTYDEFIGKSHEYYMDMVRLIDIKTKHRMALSSEEKQINQFILKVQEDNRINELKNRFEKCWEIEE